MNATITELESALKRGAAVIDVRESPEFRYEHIEGTRNVPLSELSGAGKLDSQGEIFVLCQAGISSVAAAERLSGAGIAKVFSVDGGLEAWKRAGLPLVRSGGVIPIMRQVQIIAGSLVLVGALVPGMLWLSILVGAGLVFAGLSGTCMMAFGLSKLPWNRGR